MVSVKGANYNTTIKVFIRLPKIRLGDEWFRKGNSEPNFGNFLTNLFQWTELNKIYISNVRPYVLTF